jgi:hypothetical protein
MRRWFGEYLAWLRHSRPGQAEAARLNNHGTWHDVQVAALATALGRTALAKETLTTSRARLSRQFLPDGRQPEELRRTKSFDYSAYNLEGWAHLEQLAAGHGITLWNDGPARGLRYLEQHLADWPHPDTSPNRPASLKHLQELVGRSVPQTPPALNATKTTKAHPAWSDAGFESFAPGPHAVSGVREGWEVQKTGREAIQSRLIVTGIEDAARAHSGRRCVSLVIPKDTVGFEFVTLGQRVKVDAASDCEASLWVRWPDGPDTAPANASATSGHRSAIVSFWARHRDGTGDFAGRDEWLFDNQWHRLSFRFRATHPRQPTLLYVSLLPNQKPAATTVFVDDFELTESDGKAEAETRKGSVVLDADFSAQKAGAISPPWCFANIGGKGISGKVVESDGGRFVTLAMGAATSNYESAQLWQHVELRPGVRYEVSCRMRWDNFAPGAPAPIVNYGIYHEATRTWYGPVDQVLEKTGEWRTYRFAHIPPLPGPWKLYVQLNGWGNFANGVTVSFDQFQCTPRLP